MVCKGMKFSRFPLDEHVCYLILTSCKWFALNQDFIFLRWVGIYFFQFRDVGDEQL